VVENWTFRTQWSREFWCHLEMDLRPTICIGCVIACW
jgi:hypothetical protein